MSGKPNEQDDVPTTIPDLRKRIQKQALEKALQACKNGNDQQTVQWLNVANLAS